MIADFLNSNSHSVINVQQKSENVKISYDASLDLLEDRKKNVIKERLNKY